jgi:hypothetical protein
MPSGWSRSSTKRPNCPRPNSSPGSPVARREGPSPLPEAHSLIWQDGAPAASAPRASGATRSPPSWRCGCSPSSRPMTAPRPRCPARGDPGPVARGADRVAAACRLDHFLMGDDANARTMAAKAADGTGGWAVQGRWTTALSAWRQNARPPKLRSRAGGARHRCRPACRRALLGRARRHGVRPSRQGRGAAPLRLAVPRELLWPARAPGAGHARRPRAARTAGRDRLGRARPPPQHPRRRRAGRDRRDRSGRPGHPPAGADRPAAGIPQPRPPGRGRSDLPATTVWLAHNCPAGVTATAEARYPDAQLDARQRLAVEKALVYAHTLQESGFATRWSALRAPMA